MVAQNFHRLNKKQGMTKYLPRFTGVCARSRYRAEKVLENDDVKLLWDFHVQSDHVIEHCRPDLLLVKKKSKEAIIIDLAVPGDTYILYLTDQTEPVLSPF